MIFTWRTTVLLIVVATIAGAILLLEQAKPMEGSGKRVTLATTTDKVATYPPAVEFSNPTGFINSPSPEGSDKPFTLKSLIGKKVILVDFWTYSCINCIRTLPYLTGWYERYHDKGLEIVGVHTPEFGFEKVYANVLAAVRKFGIAYPVVLDSDYGTWSAYGNQYWPHEYLIDIDGYIVEDHVGEGGYAQTEEEIQKLLAERARRLGEVVAVSGPTLSPSKAEPAGQHPLSPETYFGAGRNEFFGNGTQGVEGTQMLTIPAATEPEEFYLSGSWNFTKEYAKNLTSARIRYAYQGDNLFFVASSERGVTIKILRDGKPLSADIRGEDVDADSTAHIKENRLYRLIEDKMWGQHTIDIQVESPGLQAFTFTFG